MWFLQTTLKLQANSSVPAEGVEPKRDTLRHSRSVCQRFRESIPTSVQTIGFLINLKYSVEVYQHTQIRHCPAFFKGTNRKLHLKLKVERKAVWSWGRVRLHAWIWCYVVPAMVEWKYLKSMFICVCVLVTDLQHFILTILKWILVQHFSACKDCFPNRIVFLTVCGSKAPILVSWQQWHLRGSPEKILGEILCAVAF